MNPNYAALGDVLNVVVLVGAMVYAVSVVYFTQPGKGLFDSDWKEDGFCIQNKHVPYWSSFDTCLYVDTLFSLILFGMYLAWRKSPGMETASAITPFVIMGTLGHGFAHAAMAAKIRTGEDTGKEEKDKPAMWQLFAFAAIFWFPLLKASMMKVSSANVAVLAAIVTYGGLFLKEQHGFAYVQTILSIAYHTSQLLLPYKEKECRQYLTLPLLSALPPLLTAWSEALACKAWFRSIGGHTLYDASIIVFYTVFYVDAYLHSSKEQITKVKAA